MLSVEETGLKELALVFAAVLFVGAVAGFSLNTFGGEVAKAILTGEALSSRWVGFSGDIDGFQEETARPIRTVVAGSEKAGKVTTLNLAGQEDGKHYFVASPVNLTNFNRSRINNVTLSDLQAGKLFDEEDFPIFYPDGVSYEAMSDTPQDTFRETTNVTVLDLVRKGGVATLHGGIPQYLLSYSYGGEEVPIFLSKVKSYESCYDGSPCDYEMMVPNLQGGEYYFYQLSSVNPILVRTFIDGEVSTTFKYPGRPYNLTIQTRATFQGNKLVERNVRIVERSGNNLFTPAISSSYSSRAEIRTFTENGSKSLLFAPTGYNSPGNYNITVQAWSKGEVAGETYLTIENNNIQFTNRGPSEKGFGYVSQSYKKGVNRLRPIAKCLYDNVNNFGRAFTLPIRESSQSFELVRGIPYIVKVSDPDVARYRLEESGSHLVMMPARYEDFGETYHLGSGGTYSVNSEVVFTPTVPASQDDGLNIELMNENNEVLYRTNLTVKQSTCGTPTSGLSTGAPNLNSFKKRINSIRPVLNSLFVAGS